MKKIYILLIIFSLNGFISFADEVTIETAKLVAKNAFIEKAADVLSLAYKDIVPELETTMYNEGTPLIYVFNINTDKGFVIVSAHDNVYPVLGFSYESSFDAEDNDMPPNFLSWLENYKEQIEYAFENNLESGTKITSKWEHFSQEEFDPDSPKAMVSPLISTKWGQGPPYNSYCPPPPPATHSLVGCLATAMAQIMKYWNYPAQGQGSHSYPHPTYGLIFANFGDSTYNWNNMPNQGSDPGNEIAKISFHAGVSVNMNYGTTLSGPGGANWISDINVAFKTYFKYDESVKFEFRSNFPNPGDWESKLKAELDSNRPILYYGNNDGDSAHSFIFDGYENDNHFHINWGWTGRYDGYYFISSLNNGNGNFTSQQGATLNIKPKNDFLKLTQPENGQLLHISDVYEIKWISSGFGEKVKIELIKGSTATTLFDDIDNDGSEIWDIDNTPSGFSPALDDDYKIRITQDGGDNITDESDGFFEIVGFEDMEVTAPYNGQIWTTGSSYFITWVSAVHSGNLKIELCIGTSVVAILKNSTDDDGIEQCLIPSSISSGTNYRIKLTKVIGASTYIDYSDNFTLVSPNISINTPTNTAVWAGGGKHSHKIEWTSNFSDNVNIDLVRNGAVILTIPIKADAFNDRLHLWEIDDNPSITWGDIYQIKISRVSNPTVAGVSQANFTISASYLNVTYPNAAGEVIEMGHEKQLIIQTNISQKLRYEIWRNGVKKKTIGTYNKNDQSNTGLFINYTFKPEKGVIEPGGGYKIRVVSGEDETVFGESTDPFTLKGIIITNPDPGAGIPSYPNGANIPLTWDHNLDPTKKVNIKIIDSETGTVVLELLNQDNDGSENIPVQDNSGNPLVICKIYKIQIEYAEDTDINDSGLFHVEDIAPVDNFWLGLVSSDWLDPNNWSSLTVPTGENVFIDYAGIYPEIDGDHVSINDLNIATGASLIISPTGSLTTWGLFTNDGIFTIQSDDGAGYAGSFIDMGGLAGTGMFYFTRNMLCTGIDGGSSNPFGWHYLAAPIDGFTTDDLINYYVNQWDETTSMWMSYEGLEPCVPYAPAESLNVLEAFSINYADDWACPGGTAYDLEFSGPFTAIHTGPYSTAATFSGGTYAGWNMFGNPYPSGLDLDIITWDPNAIQGAAFYDGCAGNYVYYSSAVPGVNSIVSPGLGFFMEYTAAGTFTVSNTERAHGADWFWKAEVSDLLTLEITGDERSDITYIRFMEEAHTGFGKDGDFHKLFSKGVPQIYTMAGDEMLAVNALPAAENVLMGFTAKGSGIYTIEAIETSDFSKVYLEDKETGVLTDLLSDSYTFYHKDGDDPNRFTIHFSEISISTESNGFVIYSSKNNIVIYNINNQQGDVSIYNFVGQFITMKQLEDGLNNITLDYADGYYIVNVKTSESVVNKKVYIH